MFLKIEPIGFSDGLDMDCEKKEAKDDYKFLLLFAWSHWYRCHSLGLAYTEEGIILTGIQKGINKPILDKLRLKCLIETQEGLWSIKK